MAKNKDTTAMDHIIASLKKDKKATYADIKAAADKKKIKGVFPIMFGRAQAMLGIVKSAKRGEGKFARASAAKRAGLPAPVAVVVPVKRGPGRPRTNPLPSSNGFESILAAVQQSQRDSVTYRATLERIQAMIGEVLA